VPEGEEDHRGVAVAPPVALGGRYQSLDLAFGQVLPGSPLPVRRRILRTVH
jgi:hypothetical protein